MITNRMTLLRLINGVSTTVASHLPVQLDTVNIDLILNAGGTIPTDSYDLYSEGWINPVPQRGDYFVDEPFGAGGAATGTAYSVFGNPAIYDEHIEVRITKYPGVVP